jgi:uncharacterized protein
MSSAALAIPSRFATAQPMAAKDVLYGGGRYQLGSNAPMQFCLTRFEAISGQRQLIAAPFFPHALAQHPTLPNRVIAFEKIGQGAAEFDLRSGALTRTIAPRVGKYFYGHGSFSPDGKLLYCTESDAGGGQGSLGVFDATSLKPLGHLPSHGANPHDCELIDNGRVMLVTNGGGVFGTDALGSLCWVDTASGKLLRRLTVNGERFNAGHLSVQGDFAVVVTAPRAGLDTSELGSVQVASNSTALRKLSDPSQLTQRLGGESLSTLIVPASNDFFVTHPTPGLATRWDMKTLALKATYELPKARGLALSADKNQLFASYGLQADLASISLNTNKKPASAPMLLHTGTVLAGSHLKNLSI